MAGVTANQVTLGALALSLALGALLFATGAHQAVLWLVPVVLFLRMGLNAIDGMLAREHGQASPLGAALNELSDLASDAAIYLPFALVLWPGWIVAVVVLSLIAEAAGLLGPMLGARRRYDGPFGKSDRAVAFGLASILLACGLISPQGLSWALPVLVALSLWTIVNRVRGALEEVAK